MEDFAIRAAADLSTSGREFLQAEMEKLLEEAKLDDRAATLAVVGVESLHIIRDLYGGELTAEILRIVASLFEEPDAKGRVLGWTEGLRFVALFTECTLEHATELSSQVIERVRDVDLKAGKHRLNLAPNVGLAHSQHAADFKFDTLLQVATEGAEIASSSGGGKTVHTELYEIVQPGAPARKKRKPPVVKRAPQPVAPRTVTPQPTTAPEPSVEPAPRSVPDSHSAPAPLEAPAPIAETTQPASPAATLESSLAAGQVHDRMLEHMLREMFALHSRHALDPADLEQQVIGAVRRWSEESRETLNRELYEQQQSELDQLRRRLAKVTERAEQTEAELSALRSRADEPVGIESAFRVVQGLDFEDANYELKSGLMRQILNANLDLMRQIH